ncbi:Forkhead box protein J1-B [Taenia crassiceps]|uniref:Forkhead box protein J1-B n=1 Tax=Taenia crassiceps TaxID=6207 RepID=A0ABR4QBB5_9CEST
MHHESSEVLARRLRHNWLLHGNEFKASRGGCDGDCEDDGSLTNLAWLQNISVKKLAAPLPPLSPPSSPSGDLHSIQPNHHNTLELYRQHCLNYGLGLHQSPLPSCSAYRQTLSTWRIQRDTKRNIRLPFKRRGTLLKRFKNSVPALQVFKGLPSTSTVYTMSSNACQQQNQQPHALWAVGPMTLLTDASLSSTLPTIEDLAPEERVEFRTNQMLQPPFTHTALICMSMQAMGKNKITLDEIYNWMAENFAFYRDSEPTWKLALRQTLMRNSIFQRVPRRKEEPGGWGDMWRLHPDIRSKLRHLSFRDAPPQTPSKSSIIAPKLIIQSIIKTKVDDAPPAGQLADNEEPHGQQRENKEDDNHLVEDLKLEMAGEEEPKLEDDWWSGDLTENVDRLVGDLEEDNPDMRIHLGSPASFSVGTPNTPTDDQPWVDDRLNLEELDNILGLK